MLKQYSRYNSYNWNIIVYYNVNADDKQDVLEMLYYLHCTEKKEKTIWFIMTNGKIGETQYQYKTTIKIPQVVITSAYSEKSGTDAKQIELQGQIEENGQDSFIEVEIITDLEDLHIDNTVGTDDSAYDPDFGQETTETDSP